MVYGFSLRATFFVKPFQKQEKKHCGSAPRELLKLKVLKLKNHFLVKQDLRYARFYTH